MTATATPAILHYCWFGPRPLPASVRRYVSHWQRMMSECELVRWDESNFDVDAWPYARAAYAAGKFAFVSDVARLYALHERGGVYLDTDVEIRRPLTPLLDGKVVLGFEEGNYVATSTMIAPPHSRTIGDFLDSYAARPFRLPGGTFDLTTNVSRLTNMLETVGLKRDGSAQTLHWRGEPVTIMAQSALSPLDYPNGIDKSDASTFTIHHFEQSWSSAHGRVKTAARKALIATIGGQRVKRLRVAMQPSLPHKPGV